MTLNTNLTTFDSFYNELSAIHESLQHIHESSSNVEATKSKIISFLENNAYTQFLAPGPIQAQATKILSFKAKLEQEQSSQIIGYFISLEGDLNQDKVYQANLYAKIDKCISNGEIALACNLVNNTPTTAELLLRTNMIADKIIELISQNKVDVLLNQLKMINNSTQKKQFIEIVIKNINASKLDDKNSMALKELQSILQGLQSAGSASSAAATATAAAAVFPLKALTIEIPGKEEASTEKLKTELEQLLKGFMYEKASDLVEGVSSIKERDDLRKIIESRMAEAFQKAIIANNKMGFHIFMKDFLRYMPFGAIRDDSIKKAIAYAESLGNKYSPSILESYKRYQKSDLLLRELSDNYKQTVGKNLPQLLELMKARREPDKFILLKHIIDMASKNSDNEGIATSIDSFSSDQTLSESQFTTLENLFKQSQKYNPNLLLGWRIRMAIKNSEYELALKLLPGLQSNVLRNLLTRSLFDGLITMAKEGKIAHANNLANNIGDLTFRVHAKMKILQAGKKVQRAGKIPLDNVNIQALEQLKTDIAALLDSQWKIKEEEWQLREFGSFEKAPDIEEFMTGPTSAWMNLYKSKFPAGELTSEKAHGQEVVRRKFKETASAEPSAFEKVKSLMTSTDYEAISKEIAGVGLEADRKLLNEIFGRKLLSAVWVAKHSTKDRKTHTGEGVAMPYKSVKPVRHALEIALKFMPEGENRSILLTAFSNELSQLKEYWLKSNIAFTPSTQTIDQLFEEYLKNGDLERAFLLAKYCDYNDKTKRNSLLEKILSHPKTSFDLAKRVVQQVVADSYRTTGKRNQVQALTDDATEILATPYVRLMNAARSTNHVLEKIAILTNALLVVSRSGTPNLTKEICEELNRIPVSDLIASQPLQELKKWYDGRIYVMENSEWMALDWLEKKFSATVADIKVAAAETAAEVEEVQITQSKLEAFYDQMRNDNFKEALETLDFIQRDPFISSVDKERINKEIEEFIEAERIPLIQTYDKKIDMEGATWAEKAKTKVEFRYIQEEYFQWIIELYLRLDPKKAEEYFNANFKDVESLERLLSSGDISPTLAHRALKAIIALDIDNTRKIGAIGVGYESLKTASVKETDRRRAITQIANQMLISTILNNQDFMHQALTRLSYTLNRKEFTREEAEPLLWLYRLAVAVPVPNVPQQNFMNWVNVNLLAIPEPKTISSAASQIDTKKAIDERLVNELDGRAGLNKLQKEFADGNYAKVLNEVVKLPASKERDLLEYNGVVQMSLLQYSLKDSYQQISQLTIHILKGYFIIPLLISYKNKTVIEDDRRILLTLERMVAAIPLVRMQNILSKFVNEGKMREAHFLLNYVEDPLIRLQMLKFLEQQSPLFKGTIQPSAAAATTEFDKKEAFASDSSAIYSVIGGTSAAAQPAQVVVQINLNDLALDEQFRTIVQMPANAKRDLFLRELIRKYMDIEPKESVKAIKYFSSIGTAYAIVQELQQKNDKETSASLNQAAKQLFIEAKALATTIDERISMQAKALLIAVLVDNIVLVQSVLNLMTIEISGKKIPQLLGFPLLVLKICINSKETLTAAEKLIVDWVTENVQIEYEDV